ncbi:MAG: hypothetical protein HND57_00175 [Planctomycetes bacterium]|nr:hypothetical protein [Planctomycetota bacterium]
MSCVSRFFTTFSTTGGGSAIGSAMIVGVCLGGLNALPAHAQSDKYIQWENWGELIPGDDGCTPQYATATHAAMSEIAARNAECGLIGFLVDHLLIPNELDTECRGPGGNTRSLLEWIRYGSIMEDDTFPTLRPFRHFYDPTRDRGLTDDVPFVYTSSLLWAYNDSGNDWDWVAAREYYYQYLTDSSARDREYACARLFRSIGHVAHLIEDKAQPQHTRDDAHGPFEGAPYEEYIGDLYGTAAEIDAMLGNLVEWNGATRRYSVSHRIPTFNVLPALDRNEEARHLTRWFKAFWDTEQYQGQRPFGGFSNTMGMAEFSNFYFVTDDTMFTGDERVSMPQGYTAEIPRVGQNDMHYFAYPTLGSLYTVDYPANLSLVSLGRVGEGVGSDRNVWFDDFGLYIPNYCTERTYEWDDDTGHARGRIGFFGTRHDPNNWDAHAEVLLPRGIAYVSGMFDYFFRGRVDVRVSWDDQQSAFVLDITNRSGQTLRNGTWELYEDDDNHSRHRVRRADFGSYSGSLGDGQTFQATFQRSSNNARPLTLVFRGGIGEEQGSAIAARAFVATN